MPAFLTHCIFAEEVINKIKDKDIKNTALDRKPVYLLGAQGPDIFFFYKAKPWIKYDGVERLGLLMHDKDTSRFFTSSLSYIKEQVTDKQDTMVLTAYLLGYICHFALDSTTHPYIHYFAGIEGDITKDRKYHNYHKRLESILDAYMFSKIKKRNAYKFRSSKLIELDEKERATLVEYYKYTIKEVYGTEVSSKQVQTALSDIGNLLDLLYDPYFFRYIAYRIFEALFGQKGDITYFMTPRKIPKDIDFLNLEKKSWVHPCDNKKIYDSTFLQLYNNAKSKAEGIISAVSRQLKRSDIPDLDDIFGDISYSTGYRCGSHKDLKYHDSIFEGYSLK